MCAKASRFMSITGSSSPPTMSSVGAATRDNASPARSGRPPRETTAPTASGHFAAATSAAAAPVLADPEALRVRLLCQPVGGVREPAGEQPDIESEVARPQIHLLLFGREEVDEQGSKPCFAQYFGDVTVAGTVPART